MGDEPNLRRGSHVENAAGGWLRRAKEKVFDHIVALGFVVALSLLAVLAVNVVPIGWIPSFAIDALCMNIPQSSICPSRTRNPESLENAKKVVAPAPSRGASPGTSTEFPEREVPDEPGASEHPEPTAEQSRPPSAIVRAPATEDALLQGLQRYFQAELDERPSIGARFPGLRLNVLGDPTISTATGVASCGLQATVLTGDGKYLVFPNRFDARVGEAGADTKMLARTACERAIDRIIERIELR
jgi:hypothetical protein